VRKSAQHQVSAGNKKAPVTFIVAVAVAAANIVANSQIY
jgi:hypothetical protein